MEKFSIVRRRRRANLDFDEEVPELQLSDFNVSASEDYESVTNINVGNSPAISFNLSDEQRSFLKSSEYLESLLVGTTKGFVADIAENNEGRIVFTFALGKVDSVKMLKPKQVCKMLQISKYLLRKLVTEKKIRSYKIGTVRRFSLDDILDYLANNEELENFDQNYLF